MSMSREEILRRAAKLMQFQKGNATQAELENAAARLGELLRENNLTMADVSAERLKGDIEHRATSETFKRCPFWYLLLMDRIAAAVGCLCLKSQTADDRYQLRFIGTSSDVAVAGYFMDVCANELPRMAQRAFGIVDRKSYLCGAVEGVGERLMSMIRPMEQTASESALMVVKENAIQLYIQEAFGETKRLNPSSGTLGSNDFARGKQDAQRVALNHGIASSVTDAPRIA